MLPRGQEWLIEKMRHAGFEANEGGVCAGLDSMAVQAVLAKETDEYDQRLSIIEHLTDQELTIIKKMGDKEEKLSITPGERSKLEADKSWDKLMDIRVFFEDIQLYFSP